MSKHIILMLVITIMHLIFVILSYNANTIYISSSSIIDMRLLHRLLLVSQFTFLPVILLLNQRRCGFLLPLAYAIGINAVLIVDDFYSGFYGAYVDQSSNIVPRMRASAYLMAYRSTGRIVTLDYHGEYFLEFLIVFVLSELLNINYISVYWFIMRTLYIAFGTVLYTILVGKLKAYLPPYLHLWVLLVTSSIYIAINRGYNYEMYFSIPLFILLFLLSLNDMYSRIRPTLICVLLLILGIAMACFRHVLVLALIGLAGMFMYLYLKSRLEIKLITGLPYCLLLVLIPLVRMLILTFSTRYLEGYINAFIDLLSLLKDIIFTNVQFEKNPIVIVTMPQGYIVDRILALLASCSFMVTAMVILILAFVCLVIALKRLIPIMNLLLYGILLVYILLWMLIIIPRHVLERTGLLPSYDRFATISLVMPLFPLITLVSAGIFTYSSKLFKKLLNVFTNNTRKITAITMLFCLSLSSIFIPLYLLAPSNVKFSYDMYKVEEDLNRIVIRTNKLYLFITSYTPFKQNVILTLPLSISIYYQLPLKYFLKECKIYVEYDINDISWYSNHDVVFNNGMYVTITNTHIYVIMNT